MGKVALVELNRDAQSAFNEALKLLGKIDDLNSSERSIVVKVGVYNHKGSRVNHPTVNVVGAIVNSFNKAPCIYLAESDNYRGTGAERLQIWNTLFTERIVPFNLSDDVNTREVEVADEKMRFSQTLFKSNIFVSTHALRRYDKGTVLKNLLGLIPDGKKARFHKNLVSVLLDIYEVIGRIDLAVIDATRTYSGPAAVKALDTDVIVVGRDAVAVEAVGAALVGLHPDKMSIIQEAMERGLGEGGIDRIEVLGSSVESLEKRFQGL